MKFFKVINWQIRLFVDLEFKNMANFEQKTSYQDEIPKNQDPYQ